MEQARWNSRGDKGSRANGSPRHQRLPGVYHERLCQARNDKMQCERAGLEQIQRICQGKHWQSPADDLDGGGNEVNPRAGGVADGCSGVDRKGQISQEL